MTFRANKANQPKAGVRPAARRQQPRRRESFIQRNRGSMLIGVVGVLVVAAIGIAALGARNSGAGAPSASDVPASVDLVAQITSLPQATYDTIGTGGLSNPLQSISASALTADGKPDVLYIGAEYCPYCAAERWPLILALSRFGSFAGLETTRSAAGDVYPNTATFSFYGSTYTSPYLQFTPVEQYTNERDGASYKPLQQLTSDQDQIMSTYDSTGGIPFMDIGGRYVIGGGSYNPAILANMDWTQIASQLSVLTSNQAKSIVGTANYLTAAFCQMTGGQPANVCQTPGVQQASSAIAPK